MRLSFIAAGALTAAVLLPSFPVSAAVETTCLCRTDDGKSFRSQLNRHHKWACDYHFDYIRSTDPEVVKANPAWPDRRRPGTQTCNVDEIVQFKVYLCASGGCTYPYSKSSESENRALKKIVPMKGERHP